VRPALAGTLAAFALALAAPATLAQDSPATVAAERAERVRLLRARTWDVTATPADGVIEVDGRLDEPAWQRAEPVKDFYQRERNEGLPATERTEVRVLYDQSFLYVGFHCLDSHPELVTARGLFRDESGGADDLVSIMLDSFNDHRSAIQFVSNPNGLIEDLLQTGEDTSTRNANFDTVWLARGTRTADGYQVEIAIPFRSLRFEPPAEGNPVVFGIGFKRNIPRKNEEDYWPFVPNDSSWYRPSELGQLQGLQHVQPGRNLQFRPYVLGGRTRDFVGDLADLRHEAGLDAKWGVTTGLTADFTVNTDFAQEEADVQQINFTRFSLFFPEKRQLFLENQQMFQFGVPSEVDLVFTRRIGLSETGAIVPLLAGARLAGRQGRTSIGAFNMQTGASGRTIPSENFTVVRVRRDLFSRSSVGALVTNRQGGGRFNRVFGADGHFYFKEVWFLEGFAAAVNESNHLEASNALYGRFAYNTDRIGVVYRYLDVGSGFDPGVGFVRRRDSRDSTGELRYSPRPQSDLVRQFDFRASIDYLTDRHNVLETRARIASFTTNFESGDAVTVEFTNGFESLDDPFPLHPGLEVPPGTYRTNRTALSLNTFRRRHATVNLTYGAGGFWGGTRDLVSAEAAYRITKNFGVSLNWATNWVDLPEGRFTTNLVASRIEVAFRNNLALFSLLQYNDDTRQFSTNIRFNWIPKPGSDLFIVYNELDETYGRFGAKNRSLVVKLNYLFAL
jgi:hypothetical protein